MGGFTEFGRYVRDSIDNLSAHYVSSRLESHFQYEPLPPSQKPCIRLLQIHPRTQQDMLSCSLRIVPLESEPTYTALSYTWRKQNSRWDMMFSLAVDMGKALFERHQSDVTVQETEKEAWATKKICCNGQRHRIAGNLYDALLLLRDVRPSNTEYWVDAVCINQRDLLEKNSQVQMMGKIYKSATEVIVWLGNCTPERKQGIIGLEALSQMPIDQRPEIPFADDPFGEDKFTVVEQNAQDEIVGLPIAQVAETAMQLTNRQWFKRIWVLQEYLLAHRVAFLFGDSEIDLDTILTAFEWVFGSDTSSVRQKSQLDPIKSMSSNWAPHVANMRAILLARPQFTSGRRLSLREWIKICQGRMGQDSRDFVFAGLGLIDPTHVNIDTSLLQNDSSQKILPTTSNSQQSFRGLWKTLAADYTASEREVLVNLAACLLTNSSSNNMDILSFAAREVRIPHKIRSGLLLHLRQEPNLYNLPSWMPVLGATESLTSSNLVDAIPAAGGGGSTFTAGMTTSPPRPSISHDGMSLYLDAAFLDVIEEVIEVDLLATSEEVENFAKFMDKLAQMPLDYGGGDHTTFEAIAVALASTVTVPTTFDIPENYNQRRTPIPSELRSPAPGWLCEIIERDVRAFVDSLMSDMNEATDGEVGKIQGQLQSVISSYEKLYTRLPSLPWTCTADQGLTDLDRHTSPNTETGSPGQLRKAKSMSQGAEETYAALIATWPHRSLFRTKDGLVGVGPDWSRKGDQATIIHGAIVPYIFRTPEQNKEPQIEEFLETIEDVKKNPDHSEGEKRSQIEVYKEVIRQVKAKAVPQDGWILVGEAYIEGMMHGEIILEGGECIFERIEIV